MFSFTVENLLCVLGMFVHHAETTTYVCQQMQKGMHARITVYDCATRLSLCEEKYMDIHSTFTKMQVKYHAKLNNEICLLCLTIQCPIM